jgi:hypothetical protein
MHSNKKRQGRVAPQMDLAKPHTGTGARSTSLEVSVPLLTCCPLLLTVKSSTNLSRFVALHKRF